MYETLFNVGSIKGKKIYVEGADGVGKTTQADLLETYLRGLGYKVERLRFPGYVPLARDILFGENSLTDFWAKRAVFLAEYLEFISKFEKEYDNEKVYIIDRAILVSNPCIGGAEYDVLNDTTCGAVEVTKKLLPFYDRKEKVDAILMYYLSPEESRKRLKDRLEKGGESNAYDEMGNKFRNRCALNYYNLIQCSLSTPDILPFYGIYGNPIIPIDANGTIEEVRMKTLTQLLCRFDIKSQFKN